MYVYVEQIVLHLFNHLSLMHTTVSIHLSIYSYKYSFEVVSKVTTNVIYSFDCYISTTTGYIWWMGCEYTESLDRTEKFLGEESFNEEMTKHFTQSVV